MGIYVLVAASFLISIALVALALWRNPKHREHEPGIVRRALRFAGGPFPLSIALHAAALLFLIVTVHESRGRDLIMVNLEAGGGGGGGSEMHDLDMPEVPMPNVAPQQMEAAEAVDTSRALALNSDYVRAAG